MSLIYFFVLYIITYLVFLYPKRDLLEGEISSGLGKKDANSYTSNTELTPFWFWMFSKKEYEMETSVFL